MTDDDFEKVAAALHQGWVDFKTSQGVVHGPERTDSTHPHLVDWSELDAGSRNQDRFIAAVLLRDWKRGALGFSELPAAIHNAWVDWSMLCEENHPHARPYHQAHADGPGEHARQAELVAPLIGEIHPDPGPGRDRTCLALLPFRDRTRAVYDDIVSPVVEKSGYLPVIADRPRGIQAIQEDVIDQIERASVIVADITDDNPNVNYEIGIARTLGRAIILISESREKIPFYYRGQRCHRYDREDPGWKTGLREYLADALRNPVDKVPLTENQKLGITGFFTADNEAFEAAFSREVDRVGNSLIAVGWGLAFILSQRRELINRIRRRLLAEKRLHVHILLPQADHPGLLSRVREESSGQAGVAVHPDWPKTFFEFARELPESLREKESRERVFVRRLPYMPTAMVVRLDHIYFLRCYGPPDNGGWSCPWIRIDSTLAAESWRRFLENLTSHAVRHCVPDSLEENRRDNGA